MNNKIIIKNPIITEKTLADAAKGIYTFNVDLDANKTEIRSALEKMYNVHVKKINTNVLKGKKRLAGRKRTIFYQPDKKKARIKLANGEKIELFEVGQTK